MAVSSLILCDTNILIEFYKGNQSVIAALQEIGLPNLAISVVTAGELFYGAKDKRELHKIKEHLSLLQQIPLDAEISTRFLTLIEEFALSHNLSVPDALIAATALCHNTPLYTLNVKDFKFLPNLQLHSPQTSS
jgi:hypothetical protein